MASPQYEIQLLENAGEPEERIIDRSVSLAPRQVTFTKAEWQLARNPRADGVRVLDELKQVVLSLPARG